ncbi:hypothetical protein SDC9_156723 [bioreactor metagenome]|uniref:MPN domain-containing protein n=1 Tax=bioreactor metagenome TaxID=1076179 RepID=A0A645FAD9_9ZZZZ|nr:DNA repair protein RadC [Candidatus Metalachnospira sp.]
MASAHDGHRVRLKNKYLEHGADAFEKHELLEMLLFYAYPRIDTNELAHRVLDEFGGSFTDLVFSDPEKIADLCNISTNAAILISLVGEINNRIVFEKWSQKVILSNTHVAGEYALSLMNNVQREELYVICLNSTLAVIKAVCAAKGMVDSAMVDVRQVVEIALKYNATSIILVHNHPGGSLKPSFSDIKFTNECLKALSSIKIEVNDHIIVSNGEYFSFSSENILLKRGEKENE